MPSPEDLRAAFTPVQTARLLLRAVEPGDAAASFAIHGDPATNRFNPSGASGSPEATAAQLDGWLAEWREHGFGFWAIRRAEAEEVIGFGGLARRMFRGRPVLNTYYRFTPPAWGHGYATEMTSTALALAARLLPELPVIVRTRPGNLAAQAVASKLELTRAPELDDEMLTYVTRWG